MNISNSANINYILGESKRHLLAPLISFFCYNVTHYKTILSSCIQGIKNLKLNEKKKLNKNIKIVGGFLPETTVQLGYISFVSCRLRS